MTVRPSGRYQLVRLVMDYEIMDLIVEENATFETYILIK